MEFISIKKEKMAGALLKAQTHYTLAGPVKTCTGHTFRRLEKNKLPDLEFSHTDLSAKSLVFPQDEVLFNFKNDCRTPLSKTIRAPQKEDEKTAAVGIRPYDARAIELLKVNFDTPEVKDPYFLQALENLTLVGLAENFPDTADFSLSCTTGPFDETCLDMLLVDLGDVYAGKILTRKGKDFSNAAGFGKADPAIWEKVQNLKAGAEICGSPVVSFDAVQSMGTLDMFESPAWEELAFACINCNTCTFVCPTCWCFDIQDETEKTSGTRFKLWDSCMSDQYTVHASGHNPRKKGWQRFRNRFMHKLKYFPDKYNQGVMCVGCGRCIRSCPSGIDIRTVNEAMAQYAKDLQTSQAKAVVK